MSDLKNLLRNRRIHHKNIKKLFSKAENFYQYSQEDIDENLKIEIICLLETIIEVEKLVIECNSEIQKLIEDDSDLEKELEECIEFSLEIKRTKKKLEKMTSETKPTVMMQNPIVNEPRIENITLGVKLPDIKIKPFTGDYTNWKSFKETFEATIHSKTNISDIQKFSYLNSLLEKDALQAVKGFKLTAENYKAAWELLNERYGNDQLIISSHMNDIIKLEPVFTPNVKNLRKLYDKIDSNVRALANLGINYEQFGSLLIPIILEKLPNVMKLQVSRKFGSGTWNIELFLASINEEIIARENFEYLKQENEQTQDHKYVAAFINSSNRKVCVFCKKDNHYSNQCRIITDVKLRCEFLKKNRLCFNCFKTGHVKKDCSIKIKCYICKGNHNTSLCYQNQNNKLQKQHSDRGSADPAEENGSMSCLVANTTSII